MTGSIYMARCKASGKVYIGQTIGSVQRRFGNHVIAAQKGSALPFHRALRKYGRDGFDVSLLETCSSVEALNAAESKWIEKLGAFGPGGYNCTTGGEGFVMGEETRRRISKARQGMRSSDVARKHISEAMLGADNPFFGKHHKPESVEAARVKLRKKLSGKGNPFYGKTHTPEARRKIVASKRGKPMHPSTREGIRKANLGNQYTKGRKIPTEHKQKFSKLTPEDVAFIRRDARRTTQRVLAEMFGVGPWTIAYVQKGQTWKEITT